LKPADPPCRNSTLPPERAKALRTPKKIREETVYATPWFSIQKLFYQTSDRNLTPYYRLKKGNGVFILALTKRGEVILVRQFRPAIGAWTYEMPAGAVEKSQTSLAAARRELWEETGYVASRWRPLGSGRLMMDRFSGKMTGWLALGAEFRRAAKRSAHRLPVKKIRMPEFFGWMMRHRFEQIGGLGFLLRGLVRYPAELSGFLCREK
jgi:8-oxo-dGTP pyrophosphatase MutT (NUDIX family)